MQNEEINMARVAIYNALPSILKACANSYSNAWCQHFLTIAKNLNCYDGDVIGNIYGEDGLFEIEEIKRSNHYYSELEKLEEESFDKLILKELK